MSPRKFSMPPRQAAMPCHIQGLVADVFTARHAMKRLAISARRRRCLLPMRLH